VPGGHPIQQAVYPPDQLWFDQPPDALVLLILDIEGDAHDWPSLASGHTLRVHSQAGHPDIG
jgi:hypothetical protein